jgi:ABC-type phosphate transport system substrate-binding protein
MGKNKSVNPRFAAFAILVMATVIATIVSVHPVQAAGDPADDAIVVIVNGSNPVDNLSMGELRKLFLADRNRWVTGREVSPVMLAVGAPERTRFLKVVCGMNDSDFDRYYLRADFTGKSTTPPKVVGSVREVRRIVGNSPGAIGFVRYSDFHGENDSVIKTVRIDGNAPTDAGYKLHL